MDTNDNDTGPTVPTLHPSDSYGMAALLLVESLVHGLCENETIETDEAIDIVERAVSVQFDQAEAADGAGQPMWRSHDLLTAIASSLRSDSGPSPRSVP